MSSCRTPFRRPRPASSRPTPAASARALVALGTLAGAALLAAACGGKDPLAPTARYNTAGQTFVLYPVSRVRSPFYSALELASLTAVQPAVVTVALNNSAVLAPNFDLAFDVDASGKILLLQPKQLVSAQLDLRTGFQTSTTLFDSLGSAPGGTYQTDSTVRVSVGQTVVIQAQGVQCQGTSPFYAKLVVDSYDAASGVLTVRARVDPNCGFKSFASGLPES